MSEKLQMKAVSELKFPAAVFCPVATSSPKLTRMRSTIRAEQSFHSSSDDSSGNMTQQAITGIEELHLDSSKIFNDQSDSMHTAIEYIDASIFHGKFYTSVLTREQLREAIKERKMKENQFSEEDAEIYAIFTTERILWTACRTWSGTLLTSEDVLERYVDYACSDWYMSNTGELCAEELKSNFQKGYGRGPVRKYCRSKGMTQKIIDRIFINNLVRRTKGDVLDVTEIAWLMFATYGNDEMQSLEYWFRLMDVQSTGILDEADLRIFYEDIMEDLIKMNVTSLPFNSVISQFSDILGNEEWTLRSFKKHAKLSWRVANGFTNTLRFLEQELNEKTNGERVDDEEFGSGERTRWQRLIDHECDSFYANRSADTSSDISS